MKICIKCGTAINEEGLCSICGFNIITGSFCSFIQPEISKPTQIANSILENCELDVKALFSAAKKDYNWGKYKKSYDKLIICALKGETEAQRYLGNMYKCGYYVDKDINKALEWYRKSAEQGNFISRMYLAVMYENGSCEIKKNYVEALKWYLLIANKHKYDICLSDIEREEGVSQDDEKGYNILKKAADLGSSEAQYMLGQFHESRFMGENTNLKTIADTNKEQDLALLIQYYSMAKNDEFGTRRKEATKALRKFGIR